MTWLAELRSVLPSGRFVADPDVVAAHARDQAAFAAAGRAACLVRARSVDDVVATLRVAEAHGIPVVTRGAGTGLAGAANAVDGCVVLSVAGMDRILAIDPATRTAVVEPGVLNADLADAVRAQGLFYAPDPASRAISTIGGNIATNAGGACCLKYGVTGDHVVALTAVLAGGTVVRTGAATGKDVAGLDLTRLLVGSEGTLAVVVGATLRLRPLPSPPATLVAFFAAVEDAGRAVVAMEAVHDLSLVEIMDRTTIRAVEAHTRMDLDTDAGALVLAQSDSGEAAAEVAACAVVCEEAGATLVVRTDDPAEGEALLQARRLALPALERLGAVLLDDVAVPTPSVPALLAEVASIAARHGVVVGTFGHAGDGNLHPTIVFDPEDPEAEAAGRAAFADILRTALRMGGTITGEHGVGILKLGFLAEQVGEAEVALMRRVKAAFDPSGILNPGKAY